MVAAALTRRDPFVLVDVSITIDSINPEFEELSVMLNTQPSMGDRLVQLVDKIVGRLDCHVPAQANPGPLLKISADPQ